MVPLEIPVKKESPSFKGSQAREGIMGGGILTSIAEVREDDHLVSDRPSNPIVRKDFKSYLPLIDVKELPVETVKVTSPLEASSKDKIETEISSNQSS